MKPPADPYFIIFYSSDVPASTAFYTSLLGRQPAYASPLFAMFEFASGLKFGVWALPDVRPASTVTDGGSELSFAEAGDDDVRARHADWSGRGVKILQAPVMMDFGYTFTAADPDGHRLRVFAPARR